MNLWSVLRPLDSATPSIHYSHWDSFLNTFVALGYGDAAALDLQDWSFQVLQQFIDEVDLGVGQLKALGLRLVLAELVSLRAL